MSEASKLAWTGLSAARKRLQMLAEGLRSAASGEVVEKAGAAVQALVDKVAREKIGRHVASGNAAGALTVARSGGLIQLQAPAYLHFHGWWPFRSGMPPFIVKQAAVILARALVGTIKGGGSALALEAGEVVAAADEATAKSAAKKIASAVRREERKLDRATKKREARE